MAFLRGLGRALTAWGQDLSATKREDEERTRQDEAAEAQRVQFEADRAEGRVYSEGQAAIQRGQALEDIESSREFQRTMVPVPRPRTQAIKGEGGEYEVVNLDVLGGTGVVAPTPEPRAALPQLKYDEEGNAFAWSPDTNTMVPVPSGGEGSPQFKGRPPGGGMSVREQYVADALAGGEADPPPEDLLGRQQEWDDAMAAGLARVPPLSREEIEGTIGPRPTG